MPRSEDVSRKPHTRERIIHFPRKPKPRGPEPPEPTGNSGPRDFRVLDVVRDDMARRWWDYETSLVTIRRKLNVGFIRAEKIVRDGLRARFDKAA